MSDRKRVYAGAVEALFLRALENRLTPACRERLKEAGLDLERKLAPSYSLEQWKHFLSLLAGHVYAGMPEDAAYYSLGERFTEGYFSTLFGRALLGVVRLAGPRRMMHLLHHAFRTSASGCPVRSVAQSPTSFEVWVEDIAADKPTFLAGVLARAVEMAGGQRVVVLPEAFDGRSCEYHVRWLEQVETEPTTMNAGATVGARAPGTRPPA